MQPSKLSKNKTMETLVFKEKKNQSSDLKMVFNMKENGLEI
jgi:hypothetical protein